MLSGFDKETGEYADHDAAEFMVEVDGHSPEVERAIGDMETPAAG